jgi:WD40 repeat protein
MTMPHWDRKYILENTIVGSLALGSLIAYDNEHILCCSPDFHVTVFSLKTGEETNWMAENPLEINALHVDKNQQKVFTLEVFFDHWIVTTHFLDGTIVSEKHIPVNLPENIYHRIHIFSPDATRIISGGNDQIVRVWNIATGECEYEIDLFERDEEDEEVRWATIVILLPSFGFRVATTF